MPYLKKTEKELENDQFEYLHDFRTPIYYGLSAFVFVTLLSKISHYSKSGKWIKALSWDEYFDKIHFFILIFVIVFIGRYYYQLKFLKNNSMAPIIVCMRCDREKNIVNKADKCKCGGTFGDAHKMNYVKKKNRKSK